MAQNAPASVDVQDIQFKLHGKFPLFSECKELKSLVSLLAVSSTKGLLFAGNPNVKELKVIKLKDIIDYKSNGKDLPVRTIPLPGEPKAMACSCDGSMLAVNCMQNNTGFLQIYQVDCFLTPNVNVIYNVPVSPESYVFALQLLWNPVIANNIALVLNDGSVTMFTLNPGGNYDKVTLGKENQVKSGCWSPKGKQIVFGFPDGKLQQFKPNLQPARAIPCPPGIHPGPFDCIAVHWLSTFQFAVIFLQRGEEMCPSLFIVNAPKAGNPSYINYYDICYSAPGPRTQQLTFNHISQWNLLLVSSANGVEVGILGTKESGENPTWIQYTLLDEARIEMPLTESKDETFPMGFVFDTASSHQVKMGEQMLPVMPMIHVLSTHGHLVSFNFLNLSPNAVGVCSPPPPLNDTSGGFKPLQQETMASGQANVDKSQGVQRASGGGGFADMTFTLGSNMVTSTPAIKDKPVPMFGGLANASSKPSGVAFVSTAAAPAKTNTATAPAMTFGSGNTTSFMPQQSQTSNMSAPKSGFGTQSAVPSFGGSQSGFGLKPAEKPSLPPPPSATDKNVTKNNSNQPLYTVPPTFKAPQAVQVTTSKAPSSATTKVNMNMGEIDDVVKQMIAIQIDAFDQEIKQIQMQTMKLMENIGTPDEIKSYTKQLNDLQEIIEQADDHEFEQDVQSLRHSMNESYAMLAECRSKLNMYKNPNLSRLTSSSTADPANRRQLAKLQAFIATNQTQLNQVNYLIDAQWSQYQDVVRRNTKNQMHIPCLDGIYQRMSKLKDLLARQRTKMNHIKSKLKQKGLNYKPACSDTKDKLHFKLLPYFSTMESLADSILSMSLSQVVSQSHSKLSESKLNAIRNFTKQQQQIAIIKAKRPDRVGLKSEVILETKLESERKQKEKEMKEKQIQQQQMVQKQQAAPTQKSQAPNNMKPPSQQMPPQNVQQMQQNQQQTFLAKPTASKPALLPNASQPSPFITPNPATSSTLSFGGQSSFVKTSTTVSIKPDDPSKLGSSSTSPFTAFGSSSGGISFGQTAKPTPQNNEGKENPVAAATPISFSAKVIGGNDSKNKSNTLGGGSAIGGGDSNLPTQGFAAFSANKPANLTNEPSNASAAADSKKSEEPKESFSFGNIAATITPASTSAASPFGGFGAKSTTAAATTATTPVVSSSSGGMFSSSTFGSGLSLSTTAKPFASLSTESSTPFGGGGVGSGTTFSFGGSTPATTTANMFSSSTKPAETTAKPQDTKVSSSQAQSSATASTTSSFTFGGLSLGNAASNTSSVTTSSAPPNVTITSSGLQTSNAASKPPTTTTTSNAPADSLFGSLNICKPDTGKQGDASKPPANIFSGFATATSATTSSPFSFATSSAPSDGGKSATTATTPVFGAATTTTTAGNIFGKPEATTDATTTATTVTTTSASVVASSTGTSTTSAAPVFSFTSAADQKGSTIPMFGSLSVTSTAGNTAAATTGPTTATKPGNIFGGATSTPSSIFAQAASATSTAASTTNTSPAPIFGGAAAAASSGHSLFGSTASATTAASTPSTASIFGGSTKPAEPPASTGGSIFGGIPKPDQSVFGSSATTPAATAQPASGLFAAAAAATKPAAAPTGGSIFGGSTGSVGFGAPAATGGSIFGGAAATTTTSPFGSSGNTAGSIFGAAAAATKPAEGGNIFGSPTQQSASSGGSIFGKSTFGQTAAASATASAGSIFGGAAAQPTATGPFGAPAAAGGGSIFGGSGNAGGNAASGGSIFGGGGGNTAGAPAFGATTGSTGFGSFSQPSNAPAFGSPSGGGAGFGAATASTGFGSPQQSAFAKPVFGGPPTFGSPPAFGAQPTFGGAPTFGSPKSGFGSFAAAATATSPTTGGFGAAANPATAKSNIFETLGSTDTGLSFGNLAQSTQPPNQQKPAFGGSSFMSYR
ncbi:nuclear pore complex protein Nup214 [Musca vetustissima]|uniref:nuclear pore complex protein Nup214 n=1 Tax=Musca vetustissima TaxID=27455 RepID=UPI002AB7C4AC|nr:nuclear pore complex protein Nup214 [Musca vetustissima]